MTRQEKLIRIVEWVLESPHEVKWDKSSRPFPPSISGGPDTYCTWAVAKRGNVEVHVDYSPAPLAGWDTAIWIEGELLVFTCGCEEEWSYRIRAMRDNGKATFLDEFYDKLFGGTQ